MDKTIVYEEFLKMRGALGVEEANRIYGMLVASAPEQDREFDERFHVMLERAEKYAAYRAVWLDRNLQERMEMDEERSRAHDLFIKAKDALSTYMYEQKLGNDWDDFLGEERKRVGDFACYLVYLRSILAR